MVIILAIILGSTCHTQSWASQFCWQVETTRKVLSFHREDRSSDPNNPQSILLDYISSCQNLRIWSLNTSTRECLNSEQLQKGKQIDEWWRQASKGKFLTYEIEKRAGKFLPIVIAESNWFDNVDLAGG